MPPNPVLTEFLSVCHCLQEAKAVTADLRALVRRELAELSDSVGGRHATREEADNTLQFLRGLVDNGTATPPPSSGCSGKVTRWSSGGLS